MQIYRRLGCDCFPYAFLFLSYPFSHYAPRRGNRDGLHEAENDWIWMVIYFYSPDANEAGPRLLQVRSFFCRQVQCANRALSEDAFPWTYQLSCSLVHLKRYQLGHQNWAFDAHKPTAVQFRIFFMMLHSLPVNMTISQCNFFAPFAIPN
jgi:hypothetical protein